MRWYSGAPVRPGSSLPRPRPFRFAGWSLLLSLLAGSCLNPQPDPFPQAQEATPDARQGNPLPVTDTAPPGGQNDLGAAPLAPEPERPAQAPSSPPAGNQNAAEAPPADTADAGAPSTDAGADAGNGEGPLVGGG